MSTYVCLFSNGYSLKKPFTKRYLREENYLVPKNNAGLLWTKFLNPFIMFSLILVDLLEFPEVCHE